MRREKEKKRREGELRPRRSVHNDPVAQKKRGRGGGKRGGGSGVQIHILTSKRMTSWRGKGGESSTTSLYQDRSISSSISEKGG